jgi:hypothetical protein
MFNKIKGFFQRSDKVKPLPDPVIYINKTLGKILRPHQEKIIKTIYTSNSCIIKARRRYGKTFTIRQAILYDLLTSKKYVSYHTLNLRAAEDQLQALEKTLREVGKKLNIKIVSSTRNTITLSNGSIFTNKPWPGFIPDVVYYDEFAFFDSMTLERTFWSRNLRQKNVIISTKNDCSTTVFDNIFNDPENCYQKLDVSI